MDLTLRRCSFTPEGIFGHLFDEDENIIAVTAEHSYNSIPKVPAGIYVCQRGLHQLASMKKPFTTFEITDVPGHTNVLLHMGNYPNIDSEGCVLLGTEIEPALNMITKSILAFNRFMDLEAGVDSFKLTVI